MPGSRRRSQLSYFLRFASASPGRAPAGCLRFQPPLAMRQFSPTATLSFRCRFDIFAFAASRRLLLPPLPIAFRRGFASRHWLRCQILPLMVEFSQALRQLSPIAAFPLYFSPQAFAGSQFISPPFRRHYAADADDSSPVSPCRFDSWPLNSDYAASPRHIAAASQLSPLLRREGATPAALLSFSLFFADFATLADTFSPPPATELPDSGC